MNKTFVFIWLCISLLILSCGGKETVYTSPKGYDLSSPEKMVMKESLLEISGIAFHTADTLLAVNDEEGRIFFVPWMGEKNRHIKFAHNGDFEDVTKYKDSILALRSDGSIFSFPDSITERLDAHKLKKDLPKGDYEGLYADEPEDKLYVLCKNCKKNKDHHKNIHGYTIPLSNDTAADVTDFNIDLSSISFKNSEKKIGFAPSSLAKNKATNEWYIISAINKVLLVIDDKWEIKTMHEFDPNMFNQPEGIAFDNENNLYISNEGDEIQNGNILKFTKLSTTN